MKRISHAFLAALSSAVRHRLFAQSSQRWSEEKANAWYQQQPWLVGSNYIPASAINELEMWQADTFDPQQIDKELGWAEGAGHEHHARLPARSAVGAGCGGLPAAPRSVPDDRRQASHPARCWCCSIPAGTRCRSWARSARRCRASTTPDGCRARERRRWRMRRSIRG